MFLNRSFDQQRIVRMFSSSPSSSIGAGAFALLLLASVYGGEIAAGQRKQKRPPVQAVARNAPREEVAILVKAGKLDQAELAARNGLAIAPGDASLRMLLAMVLEQKGSAEAAEQEYRQAIKLDAGFAPAYVNLGAMLARQNKAAEAVAVFEAAYRIAPQEEKVISNLGLLYAQSNNFAEAVKLLEMALGPVANRREQADMPLLLALTRTYLGLRRTSDAVDLGRQIEQFGKDDAKALYTLGLLFAEAREYERAAALFDRTNVLRPNTGEVLYNHGVALFNLDRLKEAAQSLEAAAALMPADPGPPYRLGLIASAEGNSALALGYWHRVIGLRANHADAYFLMAEELSKNERLVSAVEYYDNAIKQDPSKLLYYIRLGANYFRRRRYAQAREVYERAAAKFPSSPEIHYLVGYAARAEGLYDDALAAFNRSLVIKPQNADVLANLGFIYSERGQNAEAEKVLRQALALEPKNFPANYDLGRLLARLKRYPEALPVLEFGATLMPSDPGIHYQLFITYSRLKRKHDADRELTTFKRLEEARKKNEDPQANSMTSPPPTNADKVIGAPVRNP
jgi:tetratricopeptide (TPR) repeat protein